MRCLLYRAYDCWKQTWLASKLNYGGQRFQHFGSIVRDGFVCACEHHATDGDCCFDIRAGDGNWHCEVTPCASPEIHELAGKLHLGMSVKITGTHTFDPAHHIGPKSFRGGGAEIHPVTGIEILA